MKNITDIKSIQHLASKGALFLLFGSEACGVCKSLRPQLDMMLEDDFPDMKGVYVDCEVSPKICAQYGVYSLPVVKVYIEGMLVAEEAGSFSVRQLAQTLKRQYHMWKESHQNTSFKNPI